MRINNFLNNIRQVLTIALAILIITAATSTLTYTQENTGAVEGIIYKNDGKTPVKNGKLLLERFEKGEKTGEKYESQSTGENGEYKIENIMEGKYKGKILIDNKEYKIKKVDFFVHIFAGETNYLSFSLKRRK